MRCPKCNKNMEIRIFGVNLYAEGNFNVEEVIGRCEDCDFDASWERVYSGKEYTLVTERNFKHYFFG